MNDGLLGYLIVDDVVWLFDVMLYDCNRLKLAVVVVSGGATARQRHERTVKVRRVIEPGAVVIVGRTHAAATLQLHTARTTYPTL